MTVAPFSHRVRIYWEDTDAGGVVFYANYLKLFERARTEWLRALGFGQQRLRDDEGLMFVVTDTRVRFVQPARLDDELTITVAPVTAPRATLSLRQQALRGETLLADSDITLACVEAGTFRPRRIPNAIVGPIIGALAPQPSGP
jgi:acyl-CoA thioester hydrolase